MDEQTEQKTEEKKPEESAGDTEEGLQSKTTSDLDRADEIVERRNRVCEREEKILERKESFAARQAVGGVTEAGQTPVVKEETAIEYRDRIDKEISEGKHDD